MKNKILKGDHTEALVKLALYFGAVAFGLVFALRLNIPMTIDEVATVANGAYLLGYDWSESLYAMGGLFFKYGGDLIYFPLMLIFHDYILLYKAMLTVNVLIYAFIPVIAYSIMRRFMNKPRLMSVFLAVTTAIYPSTLLYTIYSRADAMLIFLSWPVAYLMLELMACPSVKGLGLIRTGRRRALLSALLALLCMYGYVTHVRGLVLLLAVLFSALLIRLICKERVLNVPVFVVISGIVFAADRWISAYFKEALYGAYGTSYSSVESYNFSNLKAIFTGSGMKTFIKLFIGTVYNLLVSSYGLAVIALVGGIILVVSYLHKKSSAMPAECAYVIFSIVLMCGVVAMSCIYFFNYVHPYYTGENIRRADWLIYGRYVACSAGPAILLGLLLFGRTLNNGTLLTGAISLGTYVLVGHCAFSFIIPYMEGVETVTRNIISLCTFFNFKTYGGTSAVIPNLTSVLLKSYILSGIMLAIMLLSRLVLRDHKKLGMISAAIVFCVISIPLTVINYNKVRISRDEYLMSYIEEPAAMLEQCSAVSGEYHVLIDGSAKDIKHYQYICKEFRCGTADTPIHDDTQCFIIAAASRYTDKYMESRDIYTFDDFDYNTVGNIIYVRGSDLAARLTELGIKLTAY